MIEQFATHITSMDILLNIRFVCMFIFNDFSLYSC